MTKLTRETPTQQNTVDKNLQKALTKYTTATVWGIDGTQIILENLLRETIESIHYSYKEKIEKIIKKFEDTECGEVEVIIENLQKLITK